MVRRLAEATKACRTRRTRGEMGLRFFLLLVEAAGFFLAGAVFAGAFFAGVLLTDADFFFSAGVSAGTLSVEGGDWDWAAAGGKKPRQSRNKNPANTATAKPRTQTLPTAESWR